MSSRSLFSLLFMLAAVMAAAVDWQQFAVQSDPALDPALLNAMANGDQETRTSICAGLARRADPNVAAFIEALAAEHAGSHDWRIEHCLRVLLAGLLDHGYSTEKIAARVDANAAALDVLFSHSSEWQDPQLLGLLTRAAARRRSPEAIQAVMNVGNRVNAMLEENRGLLLPQDLSLALDYLEAVGIIARDDFLPQCADMARLSRDEVLVDAARAAAGILVGSR